MKKPYIIPETRHIEVDSEVIRMLTKKGFSDLFWEKLREARKTDNSTSQESVFNNLNEKYLKAIGCDRYSSFDSFRKCRDRKNK
jgi:hypothetical protein